MAALQAAGRMAGTEARDESGHGSDGREGTDRWQNTGNAQIAEIKFNHGEVRLIRTTLHTQLTGKLENSASSG